MSTPWALLRAEDLTPGPDGASECWWRFDRPAAVLQADRPEEVPALLREVEAAAGGAEKGRWAVGFVAYEAAPAFDAALVTLPLPTGVPAAWFALFDRPEPCEGPPSGRTAAPGPALAPPGELVASIPDATYVERLASVRDAIERGDTYQVNFTYRLHGELGAAETGAAWEARVLELFGRLHRAQGSPFAACLHLGEAAVCSVSPELFFRRTGRRLESRPMKGTAPRGRNGQEDARLAAALRASAKERAENLMIVDMVRNDLGRIAEPGSVRVPTLFEVERYATVLQMTSRVEAESAAPLAEVFGALFPCASITGAPKVSAMQRIAALEGSPRGVYTGAVGVVSPGGDARFSVAIRTAWLDRRLRPGTGATEGRIEYGTGGGIVWDSDPVRELAETRLKAVALRRALDPPAPDFELLETLLWMPASGYVLLERHLERLAASADYFGYPLDLGRVRRRLREAAREALGSGDARRRVRLLCGRSGSVRVASRPLAPERSVRRLGLAAEPVDSRDVFLWHKTTRRAVYDRALAEARTRAAELGAEIDDVVLWNERGELTETTIANLVLELDGEAVTPPTESGLLAGTYRADLLARGDLRERVLTLDDLARSERVVLVSSVRGRIPARLVADDPPAANRPSRRTVDTAGAGPP